MFTVRVGARLLTPWSVTAKPKPPESDQLEIEVPKLWPMVSGLNHTRLLAVLQCAALAATSICTLLRPLTTEPVTLLVVRWVSTLSVR